MRREILRTLADSYGLQPVEITPIPVGPKVYYRTTDTPGLQWFVKAYRDRTVPQQEHPSIELAEFARAGRVPVPGVHRTREGNAADCFRPLLYSARNTRHSERIEVVQMTPDLLRSDAPAAAMRSLR
jgi:hypothetical protein